MKKLKEIERKGLKLSGLEVEEELSTLATRYWAEGGGKMVSGAKRSLDETGSRRSEDLWEQCCVRPVIRVSGGRIGTP